ncbi:hypothetical protein PRZ48_012235 [Zasmidium cellare]|uniref:Uncharacterized protein n=1 Tax=Zasmidium cellare TaxID=395010 RepID=A0ABR0E4S1_ZASCE|nr:hypothetical protein PRZ48_012235 [Zasmidium cellare]
MLSTTFTNAAVLLAAYLQSSHASPALMARQSTAPFTIEPFLQFSASLSPQFPTSDIRSAFGRFQQVNTTSFSGVISGAIPLFELQVTYAADTPSFVTQQSFGNLFGIFNTTDGVPLSMTALGPTKPLGSAQQAGVQVTGFASIQTKDPKYAYLNELAFLVEICGGQNGATLDGTGMIYTLNSTQVCTLPPTGGAGASNNSSCTTTAAAY